MRTEHSQRDLDALFGQIRESLESAHRAREQALRLSREVVQHAANAIRAVHRGDAAVAEASLHAAASLLQQIAASLQCLSFLPSPVRCRAGRAFKKG